MKRLSLALLAVFFAIAGVTCVRETQRMDAVRAQEARNAKIEAKVEIQSLLLKFMPVEVSRFEGTSNFPMGWENHTWFKLPSLDRKGAWSKKLFQPHLKLVSENESKVTWEHQQGDIYQKIEFDVESQFFHYTSSF